MGNWQETPLGLVKVFRFNNFQDAIKFVNKVAKLAEMENHHPDIFIHSYNQVKLTFFTHDTAQITCKDHKLAEKVDTFI